MSWFAPRTNVGSRSDPRQFHSRLLRERRLIGLRLRVVGALHVREQFLAERGDIVRVLRVVDEVLTLRDKPLVEQLCKLTNQNDYRFQDMIIAICQSEAFRGRSKP